MDFPELINEYSYYNTSIVASFLIPPCCLCTKSKGKVEMECPNACNKGESIFLVLEGEV